jgi:predicted lipoprotein
MDALPDSVTEAFEDPGAIAEAQAALMDLKVLLSTEVASVLGITIGFGDSDGDS